MAAKAVGSNQSTLRHAVRWKASAFRPPIAIEPSFRKKMGLAA